MGNQGYPNRLTSRGRRLRQRLGRVLPPLVAIIALVGANLSGIAMATHGIDNTGSFEIDGNAVVDTDLDWENTSTIHLVPDPVRPDTDDIFTQGSKEEQDPAEWTVTDGNVSRKSDARRLFTASGTDPDGDFHIYAGFERLQAQGQGDVHANFEFNQGTAGMTSFDGGQWPTRVDGDLLVSYDYPGGTAPVDVDVYSWLNDHWEPVNDPTATGDINNAGPITRPASLALSGDDDTIGVQNFGEVDLNFTDTFFGGDPANQPCRAFGFASLKTRASGESFTAALEDLVGPDQTDIDTCSEVILDKVDAEGNSLAGAELELYRYTGGAPFDPGSFDATSFDPSSGDWTLVPHSDTADACTTDADPTTDDCVWDALGTGYFVGWEAGAPDGYALSEPRAHLFDLTEGLQHESWEFQNPRIPYEISVQPDGTNAIGHGHDFTVELLSDPDLDGTIDTPVEGETVDLAWSGPGTVADDCTTDTTGQCSVTVTSDQIASGTLTGTFTTPYQHATAPTEATATTGSPASNITEIEDSATKEWLGFTVDLDADGTNLVGEAHVFDATVTLTGVDSGATVDVGDIDVTAAWDGPDGSTVDTSTCTATGATDASQGDTFTCSFTVDSDSTPGTGTLTVTEVSGTIDGDSLVLTDDGAGDSFAFSGDDDVTASKTWVAFEVVITPPDDVNQVGFDHDFAISVFRYDGDGEADLGGVDASHLGNPTDAELYTGDATLALSPTWDGPGTATDDCDGDLTDGTCTATVSSATTGSGTLTVDNLTATVGDGLRTDLADLPESENATFTDDTATKTFVDYGLIIDEDATNLLGQAHTFTVTATRDDGTGSTALPGAELDFEWVGPVESTIDVGGDGIDSGGSYAATCTTDAAGQCTFVVDSDTNVGTGTLEITGLTDTDSAVTEGGTVDFTGQEMDKTWVSYEVVITPEDATNLAGDDHTFDIAVFEYDGDGQADLPDGFDTANLDGDAADAELVSDSLASLTPDWSPGDVTSDTCAVGGLDDGQCSATVSSTEPGTGTLSVDGISVDYDGDGTAETVDAQIAATGAFTGDSADKTWVGYQLDVSPDDDTNQVGETHTFTVTVERTADGDTYTPVEGATFADSDHTFAPTGTELDGSAVVVDGSDCAAGTDASGQCDILVTSTDSGEGQLTINGVTVPFDGGTHLVGSHTAVQTWDNTALKTWVDYGIEIDEDSTNLLGESHTFTVTATRDDGTGSVPLPGAELAFTWDGPEGSTISWTGDGTGTDSPCTTDASGDCVFTVDSDTNIGTGTLEITSLTAPTEDVSDGGSVDFTDQTMDKTWVAFEVVVTPQDATNLSGDEHTFDITVFRYNGDGEPQLGDGTVMPFGDPDDAELLDDTTASLEPSWGSVGTLTGDTCDPGGLDDGHCTATVNSPDPGPGTLTVDSILVDVDGDGTLDVVDGEAVDLASSDAPIAPFTGDSGDKTWIDVTVDVSDDAENTVGESHTFGVDVTVDDGSGASPLPVGSEISLTWTGDGQLVSDDCDPTVAQDEAEATCTAVVDSADAGSGTLVVTDVTFDWPSGDTVESFTVSFSDETGAVDLDQSGVDPASDPDGTKTWLPAAIDLDKTGSTDVAEEGDTVTYTYVITNTGERTLFDVTLTDEVTINGETTTVTLLTAEDGVDLAPGETITVSPDAADHTVVDDDFPGPIDNVATVTGTTEDGVTVSAQDDWSVELAVAAVLGEEPVTRTLPRTGAYSTQLLVLAAALLAGGIGMLAMSSQLQPRRRRSR